MRDSHSQTLAQCELSLTKLGLTMAREVVDETSSGALPQPNLIDMAACIDLRCHARSKLVAMDVLQPRIERERCHLEGLCTCVCKSLLS